MNETNDREGITITHPEGKAPKVGIIVGSFPFTLWKEWDNDCKANYGDCRWAKMWSDHLRANMKIEEIRKEILQEEPEERVEEEKDDLGLLNPGLETEE